MTGSDPTQPLSLRGPYLFQLTAIFSMIFALVGFSYNVWRLEITEYNSNIRSASFEILLQLSELEAVVYAAHYDQDLVMGSPRKGWVKVSLINDLSQLTEPEVMLAAKSLHLNWQQNWQSIESDEASVMEVVERVDETRKQVRLLLQQLR